MKISIITVCFNSAETIKSTFESVKSQTYSDVEYILVDGGSKDQTLEIAAKYKSLITKLISEPDKGLYDAMNKGIALATGDIVGILNSDDVFHNENVLENIAQFHKKYDIDASVGNIVQFNKEGKINRLYSASRWVPNKLKIGFMPPHPAIFFKRELFEKYGNYYLDFTIGADYELIVRFFLMHKIRWKYSNITTTSMLVGGLSSSGMQSYNLFTKEIAIALDRNEIKYKKLLIQLRGFWKLVGLLRR